MLWPPGQGFLSKESATDEAAPGIQTVMQGDLYISRRLNTQIIQEYLRGTLRTPAVPAAPAIELTSREMEVLRLIAEGWMNKEIAAKINVSVRSIGGHPCRAV